MYVQLLGVLLLACQIVPNVSQDTRLISVVMPTVRVERVEPATLPEGYVSFPDDHAAYKIYEETILWEEARDRCIAEGARLAIADTGDKIKHIRSTVSNVGDWISVGIRLQNSTNEWVRIDTGVALTSLPWNFGEPDDTGDCAAISLNGDKLVNFECSKFPNWYVCEILV